MPHFNFVIIPYRGMDFYDQYGLAVRDLQMIAAIISSPMVKKCNVIERPISIYEILLNKKNKKNIEREYFSGDKIHFIKKISFDLFGPLRGRSWTEDCYNKNYDIKKIMENFYVEDCINVLLDFTPIARLNIPRDGKWIYWYDLIDNFTKHNRFTISQRKLVAKKYDIVKKEADFVSGVSKGAISGFEKGVIVQNCVGIRKETSIDISFDKKNYDFGFIGFVTDKFDIDLVEFLSSLNYSVVIYGGIYDSNIGIRLKKIPNVYIKGSFHSSQIPEILSTFKIGMIPYIKEKMHDESPLKLYQYLNYGMAVLTSAEYDIQDGFIIKYDLNKKMILEMQLDQLINKFDDLETVRHLRSLIKLENYWDYKIRNILDSISNKCIEV